MARLSIDNRTEDVPAVIRATWRRGKESFALIIQPHKGLVVLAAFKAKSKEARFVKRTDGLMPRYRDMKPMEAGKALTVVKLLSERDAEAPLSKATAKLRGRWSGTVEHGSAGHPVVTMTRRVGQATLVIRVPDLPAVRWTHHVAMDGSWKGAERKSKVVTADSDCNPLPVAGAFTAGRTAVRKMLKNLHGESDRRQHHDADYRKKRPMKWSRAPKNPVERLRVGSKSGSRASASRKPTSTPAKPSKKPSPSAKPSLTAAKAAEQRATQRRAERRRKREGGAKKTEALSQDDKDKQLMMLVSKAIKDALRTDGSR